MTITNMKIGTRLAASFGLMLLLLCAVAGVGVGQAQRLNGNADDLATNWLPSVQVLSDLRERANEVRRYTLRHVLETTPEGKAAQARLVEEDLQKSIPTTLDKYSKLVSSPEEAKLYEQIKKGFADYAVDARQLVALSDKGEDGLADARKLATGPAANVFMTLIATIQDDIDLNARGAAVAAAAANSTYSAALWISVGAVVVALVIGAALAAFITRSITRPLTRAVQVANAVAGGDLSARVEVEGRDEAAQLLMSLRDMTTRLAQVVGQVRTSSDSIATGSAQIATGNADLSQRTEEQASALQQTAATMDELGTTVRHNADNAVQANQLAAGASEVAVKGGDVVARVVERMKGINDSSKRIADIISVIDGIAFQTNILALNAAVEAARAGEQGRGFAVVAGEVRTLAQRSAEAAKEIKSLITSSVEQVEQGSLLADEAGTTMTEVVGAIRRVSDIVGEISAASSEQSSGVIQVGQAVSQMDQVTQQNAALVEESAAAAESLRQQAKLMVEAVAVFRLGDRGHGEPSLSPSPVRATPARPAAAGKSPVAKAAPAAPAHEARPQDEAWAEF